MENEHNTENQLLNELIELRQRNIELEETFNFINTQFEEFKKTTAEMEKESENLSMELAISLFEVFEALKQISSGDPDVRISEESGIEIISKLKHIVNITAQNIGEIVDQSHEFAMVLSEHFDVLHRVSTGELSARVSGESKVELLEAFKKVTNEMIDSIDKEITKREQIERNLFESEERYRRLFETSKDGILLMDKQTGNVINVNPAIEELLGYSSKELIGKKLGDIGVLKDIEDVQEVIQKLNEVGFSHYYDVLVENKIGRKIDTEIYLTDRAKVIQCNIRDITERKRAEEALKESEKKYRNLVDNALVGIYKTNLKGDFLFANDALVKIFEFRSPEEMMTKSTPSLYKNPEDRDVLIKNLKKSAKTDNFEIEILTNAGTTKNILLNATLDDEVISGMIIDITERRRMAEKLQYLAYYDALTDLPNRTLFLDRVNQAIARAEPASGIVAVLITNIDRFKSVNDTYGPEVGDRVLSEIAGRLSTSVQKGDTIARLSNDEFGIALLDVAHPDDIVMVLEKIIKDISYPLKVEGDELVLSFSTGVSLYPNDGNSASELLKAAGLALGTAKKERMKPYQFFTEDLNIKASELILMEKSLHTASTHKEFILHYQPYWDITTKKMVGMEALIRWQSPNNGLVPPGKFVPMLEDTGMIIEVGEWILRTAIRQVKEWQNKGYPVVPVSVNLSLIQFRQKDLAEMVRRIMGECGFYPSFLILEITESAFMQDIEFTRSVLRKLKEIGCSVSIDDFGTGYSSLSYLKRFPVDNLKIDISFIREVVRDPDTASIVMAIINMAHTLSLKTIAEGIETEEQWNILRLFRCDMGQGFYLSKPLPAEDVENLLI